MGTTSVAALDLSAQDQALIFCAHAASTWVLTLDRHLGLDYFDAARRRDRPGYLLDFTPEFLSTGDRQLLLTTRVDEEVTKLLAPAAEQLGLDPGSLAPLMLLEALRSLSGRLALQFLSAPSQVRGALGMALSRLFLDSYGLISNAVILPLDAHPELTARGSDPFATSTRGDLLVISVDPNRRHLDFLLVEVKNHAGPAAIGADLRQRIGDQLRASAVALREQFDPLLHDPDRIDRAVQSWRLGSILNFYLDHALRYGVVDAEVAGQSRQLFGDLEMGYGLSVRKIGLVFRLDAHGSKLDQEDPELPIWVVGRDHIDRMVADALQRFVEHEQADEQVFHRWDEEPAMRTDKTWSDVRAAFGGPSLQRETNEPPDYPKDLEVRADGTDESQLPVGDKHDSFTDVQEPARKTSLVVPSTAEGWRSVVQSTDVIVDGKPDAAEPTRAPDFAVLLGESMPTPQFGLLGDVAVEPWRRVALDLNGCSTVSVFGVQGSGKSYTVGSIIEMATRPITGLNRLPCPLGAVVFHYHQTQDYPPEFVTMSEPNDVPAQVKALADWGAQPVGIDDVLVLTTADMVQRRQQEFASAQVEPIAFSSSELTVADRRFLMGATANDALYLKLVTEVMRKHRNALTLEVVRSGLAAAPLTDVQRALAETRLEFASRFIDDQRSLRSLLRPGRLVIVDLRDEFIERDQALGLFVTMLNVFSGAGITGERFNKLIVFDEAHKYMGGPLIGHVVEVIREMRHKGVSIVIASQDPVNVPATVIELSSMVVLHRFNSPNWLRHIQKSLAALADLSAPMLSALGPGQAFVWANKSSDATFTRRPVKVRMRPRATKHGGSTRLAVDQ